MNINEEPFGRSTAGLLSAFRLDGGAGVTARLTDYGARLTELHVPGRDGATADIVLGFDDVRLVRRSRRRTSERRSGGTATGSGAGSSR